MSSSSYSVNKMQIDTSGIRKQSMHDPFAFNSKMNKVGRGFESALGVIGPVADTALQMGGHMKGSMITNAAVSGFQNSGGGLGIPGMRASAYSMPPGYTGSSLGSTGTVAGGDMGNLGSMLEKSAQTQGTMMVVQNEMQMQTLTTTTISNIMKAGHDAKMSAVRNIRGG